MLHFQLSQQQNCIDAPLRDLDSLWTPFSAFCAFHGSSVFFRVFANFGSNREFFWFRIHNFWHISLHAFSAIRLYVCYILNTFTYNCIYHSSNWPGQSKKEIWNFLCRSSITAMESSWNWLQNYKPARDDHNYFIDFIDMHIGALRSVYYQAYIFDSAYMPVSKI